MIVFGGFYKIYEVEIVDIVVIMVIWGKMFWIIQVYLEQFEDRVYSSFWKWILRDVVDVFVMYGFVMGKWLGILKYIYIVNYLYIGKFK